MAHCRRTLLKAGAFALSTLPLLQLPVLAASGRSDLLAALRRGGKVVFLRHAVTDGSQRDTGRLGDRTGQRNLSRPGIEQARKLGHAVQALDIPVGRILASPVYRARDTAELAFGTERVEVTMDLVADDYAGVGLEHMLAATRRLLNSAPADGTNTLLVGHRTPLEMVTGRRFPDSVLPEGAMAVFAPGPAGPDLLGTLAAQALIDAAGLDDAG